MFETITVNADHIIAFRASGKLTDEDYRKFLPILEKFINKEGPVSALVDLEDFEGWEIKAAWDDLKFGLRHNLDFKRIAVISGDKKWIKWLTGLSKIFFAADMRCFPAGEKQEAMAWLQEKDEVTEKKKETVEQPIQPYRHILLATDFSPHARRAADRARELAGKYQARLSLVHVVDDFILYDEFNEPMDDFEEQYALEQLMRDVARKQLTALAEALDIKNSGDVVLLAGSPKAALLAFLDEHDVDLIVLGSHGRRGVARLLGSVASGIVNAAECNVLTVRL